jgi:hypothetical protein
MKVPGPGTIYDIPLIKKMCDEANTIVWLTNDLIGFKNANHDAYDEFKCLNSVTVYFKQSGCQSLQTAVDEVFGLLRESINLFERFANELLDWNYDCPHGEAAKAEAQIIIDALRSVFVGNYNWMAEKDDAEPMSF